MSLRIKNRILKKGKKKKWWHKNILNINTRQEYRKEPTNFIQPRGA